MGYKDGSRIRGGRAYRQQTAFKDFIRRRDNYTCRLCGAYGDIVDHIVPYALLRETKPEGVRVLCRPCNLATRRQRLRKPGQGLDLDAWYIWVEHEWAKG